MTPEALSKARLQIGVKQPLGFLARHKDFREADFCPRPPSQNCLSVAAGSALIGKEPILG